MTAASVIVRCRNEADGIEACLQSLHAQTIRPEIVLVDSGSTDETVEIAAPYCDVIVHMPASDFTFGRALNIGARRSQGPILFALSAHCVAADPEWVERSLEHFRRAPALAAVAGMARLPDGRVLEAPREVTFDDVRIDPHWGLSNHAASWRRDVWQLEPFDETAASCEDKQWMWRVMLAGWTVLVDPRLVVPSDHRRKAGLRALWRREYAEHRSVAASLAFPVRPSAAVLGEWWSSFPWPSDRPVWQRRLSPARIVEILAGAMGDRAGARERGEGTLRLPERAETVTAERNSGGEVWR